MRYARQRDWIMVRLRRTTHADLRLISAEFQRSYERGGRSTGSADREGPSIDAIIGELIRRLRDHRERGKRSGARRRTKAGKASQKDATPEGVYTDGVKRVLTGEIGSGLT